MHTPCALVGMAYIHAPILIAGLSGWIETIPQEVMTGKLYVHDFPPAQVCPKPIGIEYQTTSGHHAYQCAGTNIALASYRHRSLVTYYNVLMTFNMTCSNTIIYRRECDL